MNAADLDPGLLVAGVTLCCAAGVAAAFTLSPRVKNGIGRSVAVPFQLVLFLIAIGGSYKPFVLHRDWGSWGVAFWAASAFFGAVAIIRDLIKVFSGQSTDEGTSV